MKKTIFFFGISLITLFSCSKEDSSLNEQIIGRWNLTTITQQKESQITVLQNGNSMFEFKSNKVNINGDTYLNESGNYSYIISSENYFNPTLTEPKNTVLKIGNYKYVVEIEYGGQNMILTNYTDGRIKYHLSK
jgi:hypothetical protein